MSLTNPTDVITEQRLSEFYQQILPYIGGSDGGNSKVLTGTLAIGETSVSFTDSSIDNNSRVRLYSNPFVANLVTNMSQNGSTITVTCNAQPNAVALKLEVMN